MKNPTCEGMEGEKTRSLPQSISTYNTLNRYLNFLISYILYLISYINQSISTYNTLNKYLISSYLSQPVSQVYLLPIHLPEEVSQG